MSSRSPATPPKLGSALEGGRGNDGGGDNRRAALELARRIELPGDVAGALDDLGDVGIREPLAPRPGVGLALHGLKRRPAEPDPPPWHVALRRAGQATAPDGRLRAAVERHPVEAVVEGPELVQRIAGQVLVADNDEPRIARDLVGDPRVDDPPQERAVRDRIERLASGALELLGVRREVVA